MIDKQLLEILVCPDNHMGLELADEQTLADLNRRIESGQVSNRGGRRVESAVTAGLVREDGAVLYPVVDDIPIMLVDEAIPLGGLGDDSPD